MSLPDALAQELRNLLALHCREVLMSTKADGLKKEAQALVLEKVFHGSAGYSSVLDSMMEGKGYYASLFERHDLETNRQGNEHRSAGVMLKRCRLIFHWNEFAYEIWAKFRYLHQPTGSQKWLPEI